MHDLTPSRPAASRFTWIGLLIALFGMLIARQTIFAVFHSLTVAATIWRESLVWSCAVLLILIVRYGEHQSLRSIGIGTCSIVRSIAWSFVIAFACLLVGFGIALLVHFNGGRSGETLAKLPLWLVFLVVVRAGVVEELFYRGFAIER